MARLAGIEPATCGFEVRRSIRLSYRRTISYSRLINYYVDKNLAFFYNPFCSLLITSDLFLLIILTRF